eukprot:jgi/Galph1/2032/GphlegSOOS_G701.1
MDHGFLEAGWLGNIGTAFSREPLRPKDENSRLTQDPKACPYQDNLDETLKQTTDKNCSSYQAMSTTPYIIDKATLREIYDAYSFRGGGFGYRKPGLTVEGFRAIVVETKLFGKDDIKARREAELVTSAILSKTTTNLDFDQFIRALCMLAKRVPWSKLKGNIAEAASLSAEEKVLVAVSQLQRWYDNDKQSWSSPTDTTKNDNKEALSLSRMFFSSPRSERERRYNVFKVAVKKHPLHNLLDKNQKGFQVLYGHYSRREAAGTNSDSKTYGSAGISTNDLRRFAQEFGIFPDFMQLEDLRETMLDVTSCSDAPTSPGSAASGNYSTITTLEQFVICLVMIAYYAFGEQPIKSLEDVEKVDPSEATERLIALFRRMNFMREKRPAPPMPVNFVRFKDLENSTPSGSTPVRKRHVSIPSSPQSSAEKSKKSSSAPRILFGNEYDTQASESAETRLQLGKRLETQLLSPSIDVSTSDIDQTPKTEGTGYKSSSDLSSRISSVKQRISELSKNCSPQMLTFSDTKENSGPSDTPAERTCTPLSESTTTKRTNSMSMPLIGRVQPLTKTASSLSKASLEESETEAKKSPDQNSNTSHRNRLQIDRTPVFSILSTPEADNEETARLQEKNQMKIVTNEVRRANESLEKATAELDLSPFLSDDHLLSPGEALFDDVDLFSEIFPSDPTQEYDNSRNLTSPSVFLRTATKVQGSQKNIQDKVEPPIQQDPIRSVRELLSNFGQETKNSTACQENEKESKYSSSCRVFPFYRIVLLFLQMYKKDEVLLLIIR